jgi:Ras-related protein Rab-21
MSESLKIVILGEGRVGKTSILKRYIQNQFSDDEKSTVNVGNLQKEVTYNGNKVIMSFWDTAGQEIFNALNTIYYQGAVGALILYDISKIETFEKVKKWINELHENVGKDIILVIAGNKFDIIKKKEELNSNEQQVKEYIKQFKCQHFFTSAKSGYNVNETFQSLINSVLDKVKPGSGPSKKKGINIVDNSKDKKNKKGGCC